jgi:hypothetical protein
MAMPTLVNTLRRSLLIKVISKPQPSREDVAHVIELTASKVVEALQAQSMTLYLVEGNDIAFKQVYYSPTLWGADKAAEANFKATTDKLLQMKLPLGRGVVGRVVSSGEPVFFRNSETQAPFMNSLSSTTGFEVRSMLTVPLKTTTVLGAIQVLNKELSAGTRGEFTDADLVLLQEVAEYSASMMQRMLDPKFQLGPDDTAKFVARLTDHPFVTSLEQLGEVDEKLLEIVGDAIIRREGVFPYRRLERGQVAVLMVNPLDFAKRESFQEATDLFIEDISVASTSLLETLLKKFFKESKSGQDATETDIDLGSVTEAISSAYGESATSGDVKPRDFESEESAPVIQLANRIIEDAYISGASDIHIEPQEKDLMVRYRIDGLCQEKLLSLIHI